MVKMRMTSTASPHVLLKATSQDLKAMADEVETWDGGAPTEIDTTPTQS